MGGVRAQFSTPVNIQMSLYSIPFYAKFEEVVGHPADYRPQGYLFLATKDSHVAYLRANFERQKKLGLTTARLLPAGEIRAMLPQLRSDDILGGSFCSTDGFVDPYSAMIGFIKRAVENGVTVWKSEEATGILKNRARVAGVSSGRDPWQSRAPSQPRRSGSHSARSRADGA
jgi:sarcosine oxidase subunit beta